MAVKTAESESNTDKLKKDLISQFNKQFPDSPLEQMNESNLAEVPGWMTTGNYALNWIVSKDMYKGLPMGRVILFTGDPGSGKSMIALSMMREKDIDLIVYMDSEGGGVTEDFADFLGIDTSKILYTPIDTVEDLIGRMEKVIDTIEKNKSSKNVLMVIDSISMLTTEREKDPNGGADMGAKAKLTRQFFRTYARKMQKLNIACVMTAHLTENIGGYGPTKTVAGGTIMGYMPSIEVRFTRNNKDSEMEQSAVGTSMVKIRGEIIKSRFGTQGKRVNFDLSMQSGLDEYAGLGDILKDYGFMIPASADLEGQIEEKKVPKKSSGWWMFKPWDNPVTERLFKKMQDEGLTSSGKFREKQVKDFCAEHEWFRDDVAYLLSSIYDRNLVSETEIVENAEKLLVEDNATPISGDVSEIVDEKVEEPKKPAKKTTAKKSTAKSDVKVTKVK
jgi:RecA/RadA recombinase